MIQGDGGCCQDDRPKANPFTEAAPAAGTGRPTPGYYSLLWANHELNGMSWADIVSLIQLDTMKWMAEKDEEA